MAGYDGVMGTIAAMLGDTSAPVVSGAGAGGGEGGVGGGSGGGGAGGDGGDGGTTTTASAVAGSAAVAARPAGPLSAPSLALAPSDALSIVAAALRSAEDGLATDAVTHGMRRATLDGSRRHSRAARAPQPTTAPRPGGDESSRRRG
mmetsp:Transcript_28664/g.98954  ORF Transcript_28664/g.98954 Transcript_28664/m.98954 type:complete len:147 (-) Transcript_28664:39-479(-)